MEKYRISLTGEINPKDLNMAELQTFIDKHKLDMKVKILPDAGAEAQLQRRLDQIRSEIDKFARLDMIGDPSGKIQSAMITYKNTVGETVREMMRLKDVEVDINGEKSKIQVLQNTSVRVTDDISKKEKEINRELEKRNKLLERATLQADKFLERSKGLKDTPQIQQARTTAEGIKTSALSGNVEEVKRLSRELTVLDAATKQANYSKWSFSEQLNTAIQRTMNYAMSLGLVYGALRQLQSGVQFIADLNKQMVDIQIATGLSVDETSKLSREYNQLGQQIGATTLEVAKSAVTWLKQGKTVEESNELIRGSVMLAKLGLMETGDAANYLTATLNGYKFEVSDVQDIISKLVKILPKHAVTHGFLCI